MITFRVVTTLDIVQELLRDPETDAAVLGRRLLQGAGHHPDLAELARQAIAERLSAQDLRTRLGEWASRLTVDPEADPVERLLPGGPKDKSPEAPVRERFQKTGYLGEGGRGVVRLAWDQVLERQVAIKMPLLDTRGFMREARINGILEHPNIVPIYDFGYDEDGRPYIVMMRVQGQPFLERLPSMTLYERLDVLRKVTDALALAHEKDVLHCDLKPSNVMVGDHGEVYLMDWGAALRPDEASKRALSGTPPYMAPEQIRGEVLGPWTDIYQTGAMLYQILTLESPFCGKSTEEILRALRDGQVPTHSQEPGPKELWAVVKKAMALKPSDRYATVQALSADLARWMAGEPVSAMRYNVVQRTGKWVWRHRRSVLAVTVVAGLGLVGVTGELLWSSRALRQEQERTLSALEKAKKANEEAVFRFLEARIRGEQTLSGLAGLLQEAQVAAPGSFAALRAGVVLSAMSYELGAPLREWRLPASKSPSRLSLHEGQALVSSRRGGACLYQLPRGEPIEFVEDLEVEPAESSDGYLVDRALFVGGVPRSVHYEQGRYQIQEARERQRWSPRSIREACPIWGDPSEQEWFLRPETTTDVLVQIAGAQVVAERDILGVLGGCFQRGSETFALSVREKGVYQVSLRDGREEAIFRGDPKEFLTLYGELVWRPGPQGVELIRAPGARPGAVSPTHRFFFGSAPSGALVFGRQDGLLDIWDPETREPERLMKTGADLHEADLVGDLVVTLNRGRVALLDLNSWLHRPTIAQLNGMAVATTLSSDGLLLLAADTQQVHLLDRTTRKRLRTLQGFGSPRGLSFTPDGLHAVIGGKDGRIRVWDLLTGQVQEEPYQAPSGESLMQLAFAPDGRLIVGTHRRVGVDPPVGRLLFWDLEKDQEIPISDQESAWSVAVDDRGELLASVARWEEELTLRAWRLAGSKSTLVLSQDTLSAGYRVVFAPSPHGEPPLLALGGGSPNVELWQIPEPGAPSIPPRILETHSSSSILALAFSPDRQLLAAGAVGGQVYLWDVESGTLLWSFKLHEGVVNDLSFTPDGQGIVSAGDDGRIASWDLHLHERIAALNQEVDQNLGHPAAAVAMAGLFALHGRWAEALAQMEESREEIPAEERFFACWGAGDITCAREALDRLPPSSTVEIWRATLTLAD